ncbi:MAG: XdhC family protein [Desulfovibrio sp.]|nr:XdhC family protein [Desulfovibrio sp.]
MPNVYRQLVQHLKKGEEAVLVTTYGPDGTAKTLYAGKPPAALPACGNGPDLIREAKHPETWTLTERFLPKPRLIIFGCGHIAVPLARIAALLHFEITVFDDRPSFANSRRFPEAQEIICDYFENAAQRLTIREKDYVVIVTRGHRHDQECLRRVLQGEFPCYVGMIGSKRRVAIVRKQMLEEGHAPELLQRLHSPIGLPIGAVTPEEIALAIAAEVIREKRQGEQRPRSAEQPEAGSYADMELLECLAGWEEDRAALVTVLSTRGSTPREAGAKMAVYPDGRTVGSIGGGCAEADILRDARGILLNGGYRLKTVDLTDSAEEDGMVCGGVMEVLIEAVRRG